MSLASPQRIFLTDGVRASGATHDYLVACLHRHLGGDHGLVDRDPHDRAVNLAARATGRRTMSAYPLDPDAVPPPRAHGPGVFWIMTTGHETTILLPDEY